jgi:hypothetical protein
MKGMGKEYDRREKDKGRKVTEEIYERNYFILNFNEIFPSSNYK